MIWYYSTATDSRPLVLTTTGLRIGYCMQATISILHLSSLYTMSSSPLYITYPITSKWEFVLTSGDKIVGEIYCTDPVSDLVVVQEHSDIRMISASHIQESKMLEEASKESPQLASTMAHTKKNLEEREKRAVKLAQERWGLFFFLNVNAVFSLS